jgi:hypothetical protein
MPAIPGGDFHPPTGAGWDAPCADPVEAMMASVVLDGLARGVDAEAYDRIAEQAEADLMAWAVTHKPAIHAMPGVSQAEQACRDAQAQAVYDRWRE